MGYAAGRNPTPAQLKKLLRIFSEDLRKNPGDLLLRLKLAEVLRLLGRFDEAVSLYGSVAWSYAVAGNLVQAIMLCKLILELKPKHQETQQMLAKLYASKRIREEKQSVPVVNVDGRWVADPRRSGASPQLASAVRRQAQPRSAPDEPSSDALIRPPSMSGVGATLAAQAAKARADARREAALRSRAALSGPYGAAKTPGGRSVDQVTEVESAQEIESAAASVGSYLSGRDGPPRPASPGAGPTGPMRPITTSPTTLGKPLRGKSEKPMKRLETSDDLERLLSSPGDSEPTSDAGAPAVAPPATPIPTSEQLPPPPPVQSDLPPTFVGKSPLSPDNPAPAFDAEGKLSEAQRQREGASVSSADVPTPLERKRATMRLQTVSTPGEATPMPLLPEKEAPALQHATGPMPRRGRSLRVELESRAADGDEGPRPTRGYLPPRARGRRGFLPPTTAPEPEEAPTPKAGPPQAERATPPELTGPIGRLESLDDEARHRPTEVHDPVEVERESVSRQAEVTEADDEGPATLEEPETKVATDPTSEEPPEPVDTAVSGPEPSEPPEPVDTTPTVKDELPRARMLEPDADAVEEIDTSARRQPKSTARMNTAAISTLLRKDAEIAYREAKSTDCYAAIQREVLVRGQQQEDSALGDHDEQEAERKLEQTLQEIPSHGSQDLPSDASVPEIPLFSDLGEEAFIALVERLEARIYDAGEFVIHEGDPGDSLLLVSAGRLQVLKGKPDQYIELALLTPGAFFGEFGLLTDQRRHASVRCVDDTEVLELRRDVLADLIRDHPSVQKTLRGFYKRRVLQMVLATSPLFRAVSPSERDALIARFATRRYVEDEVIVTEGEHAGAFYVILVGSVAVTCQDEDGTEVKVGALSEGQYFGEMSLISGYPAEATVRATRVTEVLALDELAFYEMASAHPEIWAEVQRESQARAEANDRILAERRSGSVLL